MTGPPGLRKGAIAASIPAPQATELLGLMTRMRGISPTK